MVPAAPVGTTSSGAIPRDGAEKYGDLWQNHELAGKADRKVA
jgi:hypothetical protein